MPKGHKGVLTKADPLEYEDFKKLINGLREHELYVWELYCLLGFCTTLRMSDILELKWSDILNQDRVTAKENKTGKTKTVSINNDIKSRIRDLYELLNTPDRHLSVIMNPKTQKAYSKTHINRTLKPFKFKFRLNIRNFSTHTFRKTFGRYVLDNQKDKTEALLILNVVLNHSSLEITKGYLGLRDETIHGIFQSIRL